MRLKSVQRFGPAFDPGLHVRYCYFLSYDFDYSLFFFFPIDRNNNRYNRSACLYVFGAEIKVFLNKKPTRIPAICTAFIHPCGYGIAVRNEQKKKKEKKKHPMTRKNVYIYIFNLYTLKVWFFFHETVGFRIFFL